MRVLGWFIFSVFVAALVILPAGADTSVCPGVAANFSGRQLSFTAENGTTIDASASSNQLAFSVKGDIEIDKSVRLLPYLNYTRGELSNKGRRLVSAAGDFVKPHGIFIDDHREEFIVTLNVSFLFMGEEDETRKIHVMAVLKDSADQTLAVLTQMCDDQRIWARKNNQAHPKRRFRVSPVNYAKLEFDRWLLEKVAHLEIVFENINYTPDEDIETDGAIDGTDVEPLSILLKKQLATAQKELAAVRKAVYQHDSSLEYALMLEAYAMQQDSEITQDRIDVMRSIRSEAEKHPETDIKQLYWNLRGAVAESLEYQTAQEVLKVPQQERLLLFLVKTYYSENLVENGAEKLQAMTDEELIEDYLALLKSVEGPSLERVRNIKEKGVFPEFVFEYVKNEANVSVLRSLADVYIRLNTPEELKRAEAEVRNLQAEIANIHSN